MLMELTRSTEAALNVAGYLEKLSLTDMSFTAIHHQVSFLLLPE